MSVLPFQPRHEAGATLPPIHDDTDDGFHDDDETLTRFGSTGPATRQAHRVINPGVLAALTGVPPVVCEEFHHVLFTLLDSIGDFDGLLATPLVCVGRADRLATAQVWLAEHPQAGIDAILDAAADEESDDSVWGRITAELATHSLALAAVVGSNPSLTFGAIDAIGMRLDDDLGRIALSTELEEVLLLTRAALELIARLPGTVVLTGGATISACLTRDTFGGWPS